MILTDPVWGTHLVPLAACLAKTAGGVLEVGMGDWSTPFLHRYCAAARRTLVSVDDDGVWVDRFSDHAGGDRRLVDYDAFLPEMTKHKWSVVLVDHWPEARRTRDALLFRGSADYVLIHDARKIRPPEGWPCEVSHDTIVLRGG